MGTKKLNAMNIWKQRRDNFHTPVSYSLMHEPRKRQIPKPSRANCVTIQLTERAWLHELGWLVLPRWLLSRYYMNQASPELPFLWEIGSSAHEQCVDRCPVSRLVQFQGCPTSVITWKISSQDPGITILGSQLSGLARLSCNRKVDFCCV